MHVECVAILSLSRPCYLSDIVDVEGGANLSSQGAHIGHARTVRTRDESVAVHSFQDKQPPSPAQNR